VCEKLEDLMKELILAGVLGRSFWQFPDGGGRVDLERKG